MLIRGYERGMDISGLNGGGEEKEKEPGVTWQQDLYPHSSSLRPKTPPPLLSTCKYPFDSYLSIST